MACGALSVPLPCRHVPHLFVNSAHLDPFVPCSLCSPLGVRCCMSILLVACPWLAPVLYLPHPSHMLDRSSHTCPAVCMASEPDAMSDSGELAAPCGIQISRWLQEVADCHARSRSTSTPHLGHRLCPPQCSGAWQASLELPRKPFWSWKAWMSQLTLQMTLRVSNPTRMCSSPNFDSMATWPITLKSGRAAVKTA